MYKWKFRLIRTNGKFRYAGNLAYAPILSFPNISNVPADTVVNYYKRNLIIPLLDFVISELHTHFSYKSSAVVVEFMQLLSSTICEKSVSTILTKADLAEVLKLHEDDIPSPRSLDVELSLWHTKWVDHDAELAEDLDTAAKVLPRADVDYYPNIYRLFVIMATLPVAS